MNESPKGFFDISRGLKQNNPFSPFLFVIMGESSARMVSHYYLIGQFISIKSNIRGAKYNTLTIF